MFIQNGLSLNKHYHPTQINFAKIVNVPCWFDYDDKTQFDLIVKFLVSKDVKTPEIFAKVLQHSVLGFGVLDEYLLQNEISAVFYVEDEPIIYTKNYYYTVDNIVFPKRKIDSVLKNISNMAQINSEYGTFNFRVNNFWVELKNVPHCKVRLSIYKINDSFLEKQFKSINLSSLASDL